MILVRTFCCTVFLSALNQIGTANAVEIAPLRHDVDVAPSAFVPYAASHSLSESNGSIRRILFSIHSSGFDSLQYYDNARQAASQVRGALPETLIVAPQFFEQPAIPGAIPEGLLFWRSSPFRGSGRAAIGPDVQHVSISAYAVIDAWLEQLTTKDLFPQLREIVFVGHSGGGQLVQRYAMVGKFNPAVDVQMRYVVSAPSSYAYTSNERFHTGKRRFIVPDEATIQKCPGYNNWGYGLGEPYGYFANDDLESIAANYANKNVFYLCGRKDSDPNDDTIGKSCGAAMQGSHRLERMQIFRAFIEFKYGKAVSKNHRFAVVPNVGHHGLGTMTSSAGLYALFAPISNQQVRATKR